MADRTTTFIHGKKKKKGEGIFMASFAGKTNALCNFRASLSTSKSSIPLSDTFWFICCKFYDYCLKENK